MTENEAKLRYPLYCVDRGEIGEKQFAGPFPTHDDALGHADSDDLIVRCRRLKPSEIKIRHWQASQCANVTELVDLLDAAVNDGEIPEGAWLDFDARAVHLEVDTDAMPTAENFKQWLDEHLRVDVYICEGDE